MNILNRVIVVLVLLGLMAVVTAICISPDQILTASGNWLRYVGGYFSEWPTWLRIVTGIVGALIFDGVMALCIFFEVRPKSKHFIRVQQAAGGMVTINDASIVQQLQHQLDPVSGVIEVKPVVKARGNKVQVLVHVSVAAGVSVPAMATHLIDKVQRVLADDLGLQVYKTPEVRIKVAPAPEGMVVTPLPVEPPASPAPVKDAPPHFPPAPPRHKAPPALRDVSTNDGPPPLPNMDA